MGNVEGPIGVVTGLQSEAGLARHLPNAIVLCLGPGPAKAREAAQRLVSRGAGALMSFGVAGGLDPALLSGDLVAAPTALALTLKAKAETITTVTDPALTPEDKAALFLTSGASAVDMETSAVKGVAEAHGLPFMMVRAICDTADDTIPQIALKGVSPDGAMRPVRVATGLLTRPQDLAALLQLGRQQKRAMAALKEAVACLDRAQSIDI